MGINIPALHNSSKSKAEGGGKVTILSRKDASHSGSFVIKISVAFDPTTMDYPLGSFSIRVDLSDSVKATFSSTSIELVNSFGKHSPTIYLTGRCRVSPTAEIKNLRGCRYWLMIANNSRRGNEKGTPDIVGFAITDNVGNRVAYGTGPLVGDIEVWPA